jgi:hypothetical protein
MGWLRKPPPRQRAEPLSFRPNSVRRSIWTSAIFIPTALKVKELRYVLQLSEDAQKQQLVNKLGAVKDAIGEWHDWEELIAIAANALSHGARCNS